MYKARHLKEDKIPPMWAVVAAFIWFFPVGFYLLYKRQTADKAALLRNSKIKMNYGTGLFLLGVFYLIMFSIQSDYDTNGRVLVFIVVIIMFILPGINLIYKGEKLKKLHKCYIWYVRLTDNKYSTSIAYIAEATHTRGSDIIDKFNQLQVYGLFNDALLDLSTREIIFPNRRNISVKVNANVNINIPQSDLKQKVVSCYGCGAKASVIVGKVARCEYCDSLLS